METSQQRNPTDSLADGIRVSDVPKVNLLLWSVWWCWLPTAMAWSIQPTSELCPMRWRRWNTRSYLLLLPILNVDFTEVHEGNRGCVYTRTFRKFHDHDCCPIVTQFQFHDHEHSARLKWGTFRPKDVV